MISTLRLSVISLAATMIVTGCASMKPSIVKKPEIHQVRKVAIVSITAPQKVPHAKGRGQVTGWGDANRAAIADQAFTAYSNEFRNLGWNVIPAAQISALPAYQENFAPRHSKASNGIANTLNSLAASDAQNAYFSPTGLFPITWEEDTSAQSDTLKLDLGSLSLQKTKNLKTKMQEVASQAGADAAVLVYADYCYDDGNFWVGRAGSGTGTAVITGDSAIYAVTSKGVEVVKMKRVPTCGGEHRVGSDGGTPMVAGNLLYKDEKIRKMFGEVAQKSAAENVKQIQEAK